MKQYLSQKEQEARISWKKQRQDRQRSGNTHNRHGLKRNHSALKPLIELGNRLIKMTKTESLFVKTTQNPQITTLNFFFDNLPLAFDQFKILHISDLHLDYAIGIDKVFESMVSKLNPDLTVMTGDYRDDYHLCYAKISQPLQRICKAAQAKYGSFAVLGNHDSSEAVNLLESLGVRVLINESIKIHKGNDHLTITGLDDVNQYYTEQAAKALTASSNDSNDFKVALVHSPEVVDLAAANRYSLYLSGHTHGGQICIPGLNHLKNLYRSVPQQLFQGPWTYKETKGYTNRGLGHTGLPFRFRCRNEIALLTLCRASS